MSVLSFFSSARPDKTIVRRDWSQQDIADFYRALNLLRQNGAHIAIDRGLTDIGEPWLVFYDERTHDVFMHVARIGSQCVLVCEHLDTHLRAPSINELLVSFEEKIKHYIALANDKKSNVVLHPAARVIFAIAAVFLLSRTETSEAAIMSHGDKAHVLDKNGAVDFSALSQDDAELVLRRKFDPSFQSRLQNVYSRLHDVLENPATIAAIASLLLLADSGELSNGQGRLIPLPASLHVGEDQIAISLHATDRTEVILMATESHQLPPDANFVSITLRDSTLVAGIAANDIGHVQVALAVAEPKAELPHNEAAAASQDVARAEEASASDDWVSVSATAIAKAAPVDSGQTVVSPGGAPITLSYQAVAEVLGSNVQALQATFSLASLGLDDLSQAVTVKDGPSTGDSVTVDLGSVPTDVTPVEPATPEVYTTSLDLSIAVKIIGYFTKSFESYTFFSDVKGDVYLKDAAVADLSGHDIAIWSNTMSDGSVISVIGAASLIDDYSQFLA